MKFTNLVILLPVGTVAFAPHPAWRVGSPRLTDTSRPFGLDPSAFQDALASSSVFLSDAVETLSDAATSLADASSISTDAVADAVTSATASIPPEAAQAATEATKDNGWFGFLTVPTQLLLQVIHGVFVAVGMSANAWGVSIIFLTILIKVLTFPLTKSQLESTNKMQALQPAIKEVQAKYESNPEVANQKIAELYQTNDVNPLAGCLPSLVQIPIFIGLYRAVLDLAAENKLDEPFLWLPNLEGPTYGADPTSGSDWLFKGWIDGVPSLGWDDTVAFLVLPVLLVVSQYVSMQLMQPKDPAQQQNNVVLQILPVMIGWFSLNVPAALCLYWITNNIITTATSMAIRNSMATETVSASAAGAATAPPPPSSVFAPPPMRDEPAGFGSPSTTVVEDPSGVKPLTSAIDAEVVEEITEVAAEVPKAQPEPDSTKKSTRGRKKRGKRRKK